MQWPVHHLDRKLRYTYSSKADSLHSKPGILAILTTISQASFECSSVCQDWGDVSETRDHPGSRTRRTGEDLIEWTPIQQYQLKYGLRINTLMLHCAQEFAAIEG